VLKHANKKKKLVFIASTSEVYGKSADVPFRESADVVLGIVVLDYQGCETGADRARGLVTVQAHTPDGQKLWELQAEHEVGPREGQPQACLPDLLGAVAPALAEAAARMLD